MLVSLLFAFVKIMRVEDFQRTLLDLLFEFFKFVLQTTPVEVWFLIHGRSREFFDNIFDIDKFEDVDR